MWQIRKAMPSDWAGMRTVLLESAPLAWRGVGTEQDRELWLMSVADPEALERLVEEMVVFIAEDSFADPVGLAWFSVDSDSTSRLQGLYCSLRGQRLGAALLQGWINWAEKADCTVALVSVPPANAAMVRTLHSFGFQFEFSYLAQGHFPDCEMDVYQIELGF